MSDTQPQAPATEAPAEDAGAFTAYYYGRRPSMQIVPASRWRDWMNATANRNANRCLPLLAANEFGWVLLNTRRVVVEWSGEDALTGVRVAYDGPPPPDGKASSGFGYGIVTFLIPYLFRTPPGWDLVVRGPTNWPKDGVIALDGVVETGWAVTPFTMNWKLTRPGTVVFEAGEPICMVVPQRRLDLESFRPEVRSALDDPEIATAWAASAKSRAEMLKQKFLATFSHSFQESRGDWEANYFRGQLPDGAKVAEHKAKLRLKPFAEPAPPEAPE